jgi:dipeptidyl aminopeptidase/acylaminoacyl peptidase
MIRTRLWLIWTFAVTLAVAARAQEPPPSIVADGVPPVPVELRERMNQYLNLRSASFSDWHPAERSMLIVTRFGDTAQIHRVGAPGAYRQQLTFFPERVFGARFSPRTDRSTFLFGIDEGGAEFYQIHSFNLADGAIRRITDGKSRNQAHLFSRRGDVVAYVSTRRNGRDFDLYIADPEKDPPERPAVEWKGTWAPEDWSPDDSKLLLLEYISVDESYVHLYDRASGEIDLLTPRGVEKVAYASPRWTHDGNGIYLISDRGSEFRRLFHLDLATQKFTSLTDHIPWDVEEVELSPDGKILAFTANEDGVGTLHLLDTGSRRELPAPKLPQGQVFNLKFHRTLSELAFNLNSAKSPSDVYSYNFETGQVERWTYSEVGGLNPEAFQEAELIRYPTFDQVDGKPRMISALITRPPEKFKAPYPVLIDIHGGPEAQSRPGFQGRYNYFINELGLALIEPNVRGSTGYGKTFTQLDNGYRREDAVKDIGALLDWIAKQPDFDRGRICVMGGSYGGYMSLASMVHFGDRLRCGVNIVGISNFVTFLESTQEYRRDLRRPEYGDERDPKMREFLISISPLTNAHRIGKPLLVAQGANDPRVPQSEAEQIVRAVRANQTDVWYILAKDEGHGFAKKPNADYVYQAIALFLEKFLSK